MEVLKVEAEEGTLLRYIFHTEAEETQDDLKAKTKAWLVANTSMDWEGFFNRVMRIDSNRITINMS